MPTSVPCLLWLSLQKEKARILTMLQEAPKSIKYPVVWLINIVRETVGACVYPEASRSCPNSIPTNAMRNERPGWADGQLGNCWI
jgi:hypothetical protein